MGPHMFSLGRVQSAFQFLLGGCLRSGLKASARLATEGPTLSGAPVRPHESSLGRPRWTADEDGNHTPSRPQSELQNVPAVGHLLLRCLCLPAGWASPELRESWAAWCRGPTAANPCHPLSLKPRGRRKHSQFSFPTT